jgi:DNA-binding MarR family transcriptional regulator
MFERCLYFNVNALARAVNRVWDEAFSAFGLSPAHAYLLRLVLASPGLTPKQLGIELKLEKSTITRALDALERKGYISRRAGRSGDAREQGIYPTAGSERIARELELAGDALYRRMAAALGAGELKSLVRQLREARDRVA